MSANQKLTRIGVFYDGNYFFHTSNYYNFVHPRRARLDIEGLHSFIRRQVAEVEGADEKFCQVVDAHYFKGRSKASDARTADHLFRERTFDDVLIRAGVTTHYLPLGPCGEKGIDVWLALEAYELAIYKRFDVLVLIAGDGDFLPLLRKLNTLGTRVMLLGWDFKFTDANGNERETRTSQNLIEEATYPIMMDKLIDDRTSKSDPYINNLFIAPYPKESKQTPAANTPSGCTTTQPASQAAQSVQSAEQQSVSGKVVKKVSDKGIGFIKTPGETNNRFFHFSDLIGEVDFNGLVEEMTVSYTPDTNDRGPCARNVKVISKSS